MAIRWRNEDLAHLERVSVLGGLARKWACPRENPREHARAIRRDVQDDANRGVKVCGHPLNDSLECLNTACGRPDHHQIAASATKGWL
jgi:hypothetical protein